MKTKTIKCIEENINYCLRGDTPIYETPTHLKYVLEMISKEKQRKEQKKANRFSYKQVTENLNIIKTHPIVDIKEKQKGVYVVTVEYNPRVESKYTSKE